ncbi:MAG: M56 family metallopeptidase, partial [Ruminococcaceae bacterium]|nr:M56 family metallopeptidase [Oscillospiraceae bacterium]
LCMPFSLFEMTLPSFFGTSEVVITQGNNEKLPEQGNIGFGQTSEDVVNPSVSTGEVQNNIETLPGINDADTAGEVTPVFPQPSIPSVDPDIPGLSVDPVDKPADTSRPALPKIGLLVLTKVICGVGSLGVAVIFAFSGACFYLKIRRDRKLIGRAGKTKIYLSESVGAPSLIGLFRPAIYLTPDALKNESRAFIILHEVTHLRHGDHIWSIIRIFALIAFWWNPLVWAAAILSKQDAELACDHSVLSRIGEKRRFDYARVIIDMLPRRRAALVGLASGSVKERVKMMTEKHKNRILAAVLALVLVISAVGCSFIGGKVANDTENIGENTEDISDTVLDPSEYFEVTENASDLEFVAVPYPVGDARNVRYPLGKNCWVYMSYEQYGDGEKNYEVRFHVFDVGKGSFVSSRPFYTEDCIPSTISYTKNGCILFDSRIENNNPVSYTIQCAFEVVYKDGVLSVEETEHEMFPMCERYITSPDGKYSLLKMTYDGYNGGGIEVITPDGMYSPLINIMLDDEIDGRKAGVQDVRGYTPVGFIDETKFLYTIGGWEWSIGYGIYDLATDEKKEYLEGHGVIGLEDDGSFYVCEAQDYEYKNIWKSNVNEEFELIATRVVDGETDVFPLYGSVDWTHQDNAWYAYDLEYSIVRPDSEEKSKVSVYPIDFSEKLTTFEARTADLNNGLYLYEDKLYMIVRTYEDEKVDEPSYETGNDIETISPEAFFAHMPTEYASQLFYHRIFATDTYLYFLQSGYDPREYYIYYTQDFDFIYSIDAEIPNDVEYDSAKPIYVGGGGGSGECEFVIELTNGADTFYVRFDNFSYTDSDNWLKFEYRGIVDEAYVGERLGVHYDDSAKRTLKTAISAKSGNKLIDLVWYEELGHTVVGKGEKAKDGYPDNEKYLWHIEQVFDNGSVLLYVGGERNSQNEWYLVELNSGKVIDIFKDVPDEVIDSAFYVHCSDDSMGVVFWCNKGEKAYYFDRTSGKCTDIEELTGLEGATHAYIIGENNLFVTSYSYEKNKTIKGGSYDLSTGVLSVYIEDGKNIYFQLDTSELICFENNTRYGLIPYKSSYVFIDLITGDVKYTGEKISKDDYLMKIPFGDKYFVTISGEEKIRVRLYNTEFSALVSDITVDLTGTVNHSYSTYEDNGAKYLLIKYTDSDGKSGKRLVYIG